MWWDVERMKLSREIESLLFGFLFVMTSWDLWKSEDREAEGAGVSIYLNSVYLFSKRVVSVFVTRTYETRVRSLESYHTV